MDLIVYNTTSRSPTILAHLIQYVIGKDYEHCILRVITTTSDVIWESTIGGVRCISYEKFIKDNKLVMKCEVIPELKLNLEECIKIISKCNWFLNQPTGYGYITLYGSLLWKAFKKLTKIGVDKNARVVCSEFIYVLFLKWMPTIDFPQDFVRPDHLEEWFNMKRIF